MIKFQPFEFAKENKTRKGLSENEFSVWYNKKNGNYAMTMNNQLRQSYRYVTFGVIGNEIAMQFNNENMGFPIYPKVANQKQSSRIESKAVVNLFLKNLCKDKDRQVFTVRKIEDGLFVINNGQ
jgi:hypothetical protein